MPSMAGRDELLDAVALALRELPGSAVHDSTDIGAHAIEYAHHGWAVFPLRGKVPAILNPHPKGSPERQACKGECGLQGHGVLDATTDLGVITYWWGVVYRGANIGARVPENMFVLDVDPRHGGLESLAALEQSYSPLPETLTTISGRGDGGRHYFYRRPPGKLSAKHLGPGLDLKTSSGYVVMAPSIHPDSGDPYTRIDRPVADPPAWLIALITPEPIAPKMSPRGNTSARSRRGSQVFTGSIADDYTENTSWAEVLGPHGWTCPDSDPDADGAVWLHPTHTSSCSATVRHKCLFVYSTNTPFEVTEASNPNGYTPFRAYAVLNHGGDLSAAARTLMEAD